ncbi:MAG: hypothetical protein SynsKO_08900 [Synoicihabitans sp.]
MQITFPHLETLRRLGFTTLAGSLAWGWISAWPQKSFEILAGSSAQLVGWFSGSPVVGEPSGWLLAGTSVPIAVTEACSAKDFYLMVTLLLAWHATARPSNTLSIFGRVGAALLLALPLTIATNTLRILAVSQAHRWVIPQFPDVYDPILHMATGAAVFLPILIGLNLAFESHARTHISS